MMDQLNEMAHSVTLEDADVVLKDDHDSFVEITERDVASALFGNVTRATGGSSDCVGEDFEGSSVPDSLNGEISLCLCRVFRGRIRISCQSPRVPCFRYRLHDPSRRRGIGRGSRVA